jgi:hypothetical protein
MRVFRTILGMLLLTIGLPSLLAGGVLWAAMQHRDPGGAFSGELQKLAVPGYAVVVDDIDRLLRDDAPFARIGATDLRFAAATTDGPAFVGLAPAADVERYLAGTPFTRVDGVDIGTGALPLRTARVAGPRVPAGIPGQQAFWTRTGIGQLGLVPGELTGGPYSLVLMSASGTPVDRLATVAEVRPSWLNSSTWGLLTLGTLLVMASIVVLVWPGRRREIVYVVEPSQVPELMFAIGAPLPNLGGGNRQGGAHRPRTLADSRPARPPALPEFSWPPKAPGSPAARAAAPLALTGSPAAQPGAPDTGGSAALPAALLTSGAPHPVSPGPLPGGGASLSGGPLPGGGGYGSLPGGSLVGSAHAGGPLGGGSLAGGPLGGGSLLGGGPFSAGGARTPSPGQPLNLLGEAPAGLQPGSIPARRTSRRETAPSDIPEFHATAVGAWVAATAPERARQTEARAAARLREAAARRAASEGVPGQARPETMGKTVAVPAPEADATEPVAESTVDATKLATESTKSSAGAPTQAVKADSAEKSGPDPRQVAAAASRRPATLAETPRQGGAQARQGSKKARRAAAATRPESGAIRPESGATRPESGAAESAQAHSRSEPSYSRIALHTGPAATDWTAVGLTRLAAPAPAPASAPAQASVPAPASAPAPQARAAADAAEVTEPAAPTKSAPTTEPVAPAQSAPTTEPVASAKTAEPAMAGTEKPTAWPPVTQAKPALPKPAPAQAVTTAQAVTPAQAETSAKAAPPAQAEISAKAAPSKGPIIPIPAKQAASATQPDSPAAEMPPAMDRKPPESPAEPERKPAEMKTTEAKSQPLPEGRPSMHAMESGSQATETKLPKQKSEATGRAKVTPPAEPVPADGQNADGQNADSPTVDLAPKAAPGQPRSSMHAVEANGLEELTPAAAQSEPAKPVRKNNPLARAQSRLTGKPTAASAKPAAAPTKPGTTRRAPAAWIKAAESVAARAAGKPTPDPKPDPKTEPELKADAKPELKADAKPELKADAKPELKAEPKPATQTPNAAPTAAQPTPRPQTPNAAPATTQDPARPQTSNAARKPRPKPAAQARPKPEKPATPAAEKQPDNKHPDGKHPDGKQPENRQLENRQPDNKPAQDADNAKPLSYREEAAELLAASNDRRRKRTVSGKDRPTD